ncbi:senescence-specific cysteine protease SAG39-like [Cicer arietinum]|uniref:Vignain n=1 Tax=Cicer arietinum TaxID=3827 RepID=A0A1S2XDC7_CICAR|nr:senescence-specific cysteine protease SAG39-like [Cicer arietinum]
MSSTNILTLFFIILTLWNSVVICSRLLETSLTEKHELWMKEHGKFYKDVAEKQKRFEIFKENVEFIESFYDSAFNLSINQFADQTNEEFKASLNGNKKPLRIETETETEFRYENVTEVPATMDWRERGAVTPIKNQYDCGSCWAFATVAAIEGIHQISTGKLVSLSEQELVDCVKGNSYGCSGGYSEDAYEFIVKKGGIASESKYPYKGADKKCNIKKGAYSVAKIKGYEKVPINNEKELLKAVANQPVVVYIEGGERAFRYYSSGIFKRKCGTDLDHAVTIVGYGISEDGVKYWIIKNSWGIKWGEKGYARMERDIHSKQGLCGLAMNPTYPIA